MAISFLALVAIHIGLILLGRLFAPRQKRPRPSPIEAPTSSDGKTIAKIYGIGQVAGNIGIARDMQTPQEELNSGAFITRMYAKVQLGLCWGPVDVLYDIIADERSVRLQEPGPGQSIDGEIPHTILPTLPASRGAGTPVAFDINVRQMFGGQEDQGGLQGEMRWYWGTPTQPIDPLVTYVNGDLASRYPHLAHACFGTGIEATTPNQQGDKFYWGANTSALKPLAFIVGCYPNALLGGTTGKIGLNANPVEVIYDLITNQVYGQGESPAFINAVQWAVKAQQCVSENLGISVTVDTPRQNDDLIADILSHIRGEVVTNPRTGLLEIILARPDYDPNNLFVVHAGNVSGKIRHSRVGFGKTINKLQVRYQEFHGGLTGTLVNVVAYESFDPLPPFNNRLWVSGSENLTAVHAFADGVELTLGVDYFVNVDSGIFRFEADEGILVAGDRITVSFVGNPTFIGFFDQTVETQNHANQQITGRSQSEFYDYPMFTDRVNAQTMAELLRKMVSRQLDGFSWDGDRSMSHLTRGMVVKLDDPVTVDNPTGLGFSNIVIRITRVSGGTRENPKLSFDGIEDIYGEDLILPDLVSGGGSGSVVGPGIAPNVLIACGGGGFRILLFPGGTGFRTEIQASLTGTSGDAMTITPVGGIDSAPGFFDYLNSGVPFANGTIRFFRARMLGKVGYSTGSWSSWIQCTAGGTVSPPTCQEVTFEFNQVPGETEGRLVLTIVDPQARLRRIEFNTLPSGSTQSGWVVATAPYEATVAVASGQTSFILVRITSLRCTGLESTSEYTFPFTRSTPPIVPPIPGSGVGSLSPVELMLISEIEAIDEIDQEFEVLDTRRQLRWDLSTFGTARVVASLSESTHPVGTFLLIQGKGADNIWRPLDGVDGPRLPLDAASIAAWPDGVCEGLSVPIDEAARGPSRLAAFVGGGNGIGEVEAHRAALHLTPAPPEDDEDPPPVDPPEGPVFGPVWVLVQSASAVGSSSVDDDDPFGIPVIVTARHAGGVIPPGQFYYLEAVFTFAPNIAALVISGTYQVNLNPSPWITGVQWQSSTGSGNSYAGNPPPLDTDIPFSGTLNTGPSGQVTIRVGRFNIEALVGNVTVQLTSLAFSSPPLASGPNVDDLIFIESFESDEGED